MKKQKSLVELLTIYVQFMASTCDNEESQDGSWKPLNQTKNTLICTGHKHWSNVLLIVLILVRLNKARHFLHIPTTTKI